LKWRRNGSYSETSGQISQIYFNKKFINQMVMKKFLLSLGLGVSFFLLFSNGVQAQIFVKVRPSISFTERPVRPSQTHVWIGDEWAPDGNSYRSVGGHWEVPPHPGARWQGGHWRHHGHDGDEWVGGRWKR
jgi:hypothetical protein